jgi:hypothetical protein
MMISSVYHRDPRVAMAKVLAEIQPAKACAQYHHVRLFGLRHGDSYDEQPENAMAEGWGVGVMEWMECWSNGVMDLIFPRFEKRLAMSRTRTRTRTTESRTPALQYSIAPSPLND